MTWNSNIWIQTNTMLGHIQGVQISIMTDVFGHAHAQDQCTVQQKFTAEAEELEHSRFDIEKPSTILPKHARFICLIVDKKGNTFVSSDKMYTAKIHYSLRSIIPNDSVLHALVFKVHTCKYPVLGLFDASRLGGQALSQYSCIQRHAIVHRAFKGHPKCPHIRMHWVGHERVLVHDLQYKRVSVDFDIDCAVRLSDTLSHDMRYARLLPKEPITTMVPKLNTAKMVETFKTKRAKLNPKPHPE